MKIKHVTIQNFKAIKYFEEYFGPVTSFIGYNGGGKSSILQAINWFFEGHQLNEDDYFAECVRSEGNISLEKSSRVKVEIVFNELNDIDRINFGKYARSEEMVLSREVSIGENAKLFGSPRVYPKFEEIRSQNGVVAMRKSLVELFEHDGFSETLSNMNIDNLDNVSKWSKNEIIDFMDSWENVSDNSTWLETRGKESANHFFGATGDSILSKHASFVFVPAAPDLTGQFDSSSKGSAIDILLGTLVKDSLSEAVNSWQNEHKDVLVELERRVKSQSKADLQDKARLINNNLSRYLPNFEVQLNVSLSEWAPKTTPIASSEILHNSVARPIGNHGHGVQRATLLSLLQAISKSRSDNESSSLIVCIEEPEVYQHPVQAKSIANSFLKDAQNSGIQFIFATHSPYFVSPKHLRTTYRVVSSDSGSQIRKAQPTAIYKRQNSDGKLEKYFSKTTIEGIFSRGCLLVEGDTDEVIFRNAMTPHGATLEELGISVLNVDGANNLIPVASIFDSFGVPVYLLRDGDSDENIAESRAKPHNPKQKIMDSWKQSTEKFIDSCYEQDYISKEEKENFVWGNFSVGQSVAIWEHDIESVLESWPEFMEEARAQNISEPLRSNKRAGSYARVVEEIPTDRYPVVIQKVIDAISEKFID